MVTLGLCMIVKNEEQVLENCLSSCYELFDEIIIVDTGSSDNTKKIAEKYATKILDYKWNYNFSDARNYSILNCSCDYFMWLDADDKISKENLQKLKDLKQRLNDEKPNCVFIKYDTDFDENQKVIFSYFRERILKNDKLNLFIDPVHEVIIPREKIIYCDDISIEHNKHLKIKDKQNNKKELKKIKTRNLKIYEKQDKSKFSARQKFYYARELMANEKYKKSIFWFKKFLNSEDAFIENKIEACLNLSYIYSTLNMLDKAKEILFYSFCFDLPRAEILCEIGNLYMNEKFYDSAIYYYDLASKRKIIKNNLGFTKKDCYDFIPYIQMCVCYYNLGKIETSFYYNNLAKITKPFNKLVLQNEEFLRKKLDNLI